MKRKNGFTLIELLAIIVILAIIAVITVPIILNIIENSRRGAATDSAYGYKDAVNKWYVSKLSNNNQIQLEGTYTITDGVLNGNEINEKVPVSGTVPTSGSLTYENGVFKSGCLIIGEYAVTFNEDGTTNTEKENCPALYAYSTNGYSFLEERPNTSAYLKYFLTNGEVKEGTIPLACVYNETYGGEVCFKNNDFNRSVQKIKEFYRYDENTWIQDVNDTQKWYNQEENPTVTCIITDSNFKCSDSLGGSGASPKGTVIVIDHNKGFNCYVFGKGEFLPEGDSLDGHVGC